MWLYVACCFQMCRHYQGALDIIVLCWLAPSRPKSSRKMRIGRWRIIMKRIARWAGTKGERRQRGRKRTSCPTGTQVRERESYDGGIGFARPRVMVTQRSLARCCLHKARSPRSGTRIRSPCCWCPWMSAGSTTHSVRLRSGYRS